MEDNQQHCLLCEKEISEGMCLSGQKLINGQMIAYQLCDGCCNSSYESVTDGSITRKNLWNKVDAKLKKMHKVKKNHS